VALKFWGDSKTHAVATFDRPARVTKMTTSDLKDWMDLEIMHLGEAFDRWRNHSYGGDDVTARVEMLAAMWDELVERD
jgi:hypothetical protein